MEINSKKSDNKSIEL